MKQEVAALLSVVIVGCLVAVTSLSLSGEARRKYQCDTKNAQSEPAAHALSGDSGPARGHPCRGGARGAAESGAGEEFFALEAIRQGPPVPLNSRPINRQTHLAFACDPSCGSIPAVIRHNSVLRGLSSL